MWLAKACKALRVPVPGRGYWEKSAGKTRREATVAAFPHLLIVGRRSWPSLGFRRGSAFPRTQLAVIAFLVIGLPVLIGFAGFELHGLPANTADWESWFSDRGVRDVGHELVSWRESSDCTRDRRPGTGRRKDV